MVENPFAKRPAYEGLYVAQRRSTRVDWVTPVILTGRDASGQPFREETETVRVNLHGAKIKTHHRVMVGAQINIENPNHGLAEKAICVSVEEAPQGQTEHAIGVQLVRPQNLWGIENPPPDWERVLAGETGIVVPREEPRDWMATYPGPGSASSRVSSARRTPASPPVADRLPSRFGREVAELKESFVETLRSHTEEIAAEAISRSRQQVDQAAAEAVREIGNRLGQSLAEMNSALETLRGHAEQISRETVTRSRQEADQAVVQAVRQINDRLGQSLAELNSALETFRADAMEDIVRGAVQGFENRTATLAGDLENRLGQRGYQALSELERVLEGFRAGLADELMARKKEIVEAAEQDLRSKIAGMLATILDASARMRTVETVDPSMPKK